MSPAITPAGRWVLALGLALLAAGVATARLPVIVLAEIVLAAIAWDYAVAVQVQRAFENGRIRAGVSVRERGFRQWDLSLRVSGAGAFCGALRLEPTVSAGLRVSPAQLESHADDSPPGRNEVDSGCTLSATRAGRRALWGVWVHIDTRRGWFGVAAYVPNFVPLWAPVAESPGARARARARHPSVDRLVGSHTVAQPGSSAELRELRDYRQGDPVRRIDWRATARRGALTVREHEDDVVATQMLVVDVSSTMLSVDGAKMACAQSLAAALVEGPRRGGDRVGLVLADDGVVAFLPPRGGAAHAQRVVDATAWIDARVGASDTEVTDDDVVEAVVQHIAQHTGVDFCRVRGEAAAYAPTAERFDVAALDAWIVRTSGAAIEALEREIAAAGVPAGHESLPRRYARYRALHVPRRVDAWLGRSGKGLAEAIERAVEACTGVAGIVVVTDAAGIGDTAPVVRALTMARLRRLRTACVVLWTPAFVAAPDDPVDARVLELLTAQASERAAEVHGALAAASDAFWRVGPDDAPTTVARRVAAVLGGPRRGAVTRA